MLGASTSFEKSKHLNVQYSRMIVPSPLFMDRYKELHYYLYYWYITERSKDLQSLFVSSEPLCSIFMSGYTHANLPVQCSCQGTFSASCHTTTALGEGGRGGGTCHVQGMQHDYIKPITRSSHTMNA